MSGVPDRRAEALTSGGASERDGTRHAAVGEGRLRRELGVALGVGVTINAMVGTGVFRLSPKVLGLVGSTGLALSVWIAGGVISLCGALCLSELSTAMPRAGGIYEVLRRAYGPSVAFTFGWTRLTLLGPSAAGSFARLASEALAAALGLAHDPDRDTAVAVGVLVLGTLANVTRVRTASIGQTALTVLKYGGLVLLGLACLLFSGEAPAATAVAPSLAPRATFGIMGFSAALVSVMWAYDGWGDMAALAGEAREPGRTLPRAFVIGTVAVTLSYVLVNIGYAHVLGAEGIAASTGGSDMVAMNAARAAMGEAGARLLALLVFVSCVGACLVGMLTGSRVFVAMAADGLFIRFWGHVSETTGAPVRAVVLTSVLGVTYLSVRSFEQLTDAFVAGMFPFYMLAVIAIPILRKREPSLPRPFLVPLYPLVPLVFLVGASALLVGALQDVEGVTFGAFGLMLLGLPVGFFWSRRQR